MGIAGCLQSAYEKPLAATMKWVGGGIRTLGHWEPPGNTPMSPPRVNVVEES